MRPTAGHSTPSSSSASGCRDAAGETSVDVVALSLPGQYVVVAAAEHPQRFGRIVLISPTGFGRFKGAGRASRNIDRFLRLTGIGRLLFAVLARRQVIRWFLRQIFADPEQVPQAYERYCWRTCQQPGIPGSAGVRFGLAQ